MAGFWQGRPRRTFASLRHRDFRLLWFGTLGTAVGFWMQQVALGWLVLQLSHSPFILGVATALRMAPFFFLGMVAGAVADWVDRRRLLQVLVGIQAALSLGIGLLVALDMITVVQILLLGVVYGSTNVFLLTVSQAYIPDVVGSREVMNGLALNQIARRITGVPGALFTGGLILWLGLEGAFFIMGVSYVLALGILLFLQTSSPRGGGERATVYRHLLGGLRLIRENRTVISLLALIAVTEILAFSHMSLLPIFADDVLHIGAGGLGMMNAASVFGSLLGGIGLAVMGDSQHKGKLLLASSAGFALALLVFAGTSTVLISLAALFIGGVAAMLFDTLGQGAFLLSVEADQRGRAMGVWLLGVGIGPIGHLQVGALAEITSVQTALLVNGSILAFLVLGAAFVSPRLRRI